VALSMDPASGDASSPIQPLEKAAVGMPTGDGTSQRAAWERSTDPDKMDQWRVRPVPTARG